MNSLQAQLAHMGMRQDAVKLDEVAPPAPADQPVHSLMLQSTDSELAPEVQSNKAKPDETQQPATISEKTEYLPELTVRSSGSKRIKAARVRLAQFAKKRNSSLHRMSVKGADGDERTFTRRKATVLALEETTTMVIRNPEHLQLFRGSVFGSSL